MVFVWKCLGLQLLIGVIVQVVASKSSVNVHVSMGGYKGVLTVSDEPNGLNVAVNEGFSSPLDSTENYQLSLKRFPVEYIDGSKSCDEKYLGPSTSSMSTVIGENMNQTFVGDFSIDNIGALSLIRPPSTNVACATIANPPERNYVTAVARFQHTILGPVYFRQHSYGNDPTKIINEAYTFENYTSGSWRISPSCDIFEDEPLDVASVTFYNPTSATNDDCYPSSQESCAVGNLVGKLGLMELGQGQSITRFEKMDSKLPLYGKNSIVGKYLVVLHPQTSQLLYCAEIKPLDRTAHTTFQHDGVTGTVSFNQPSPFDSTKIRVYLDGLNNRAGGYHIHKWPVPVTLDPMLKLCSPSDVSGHFDPYDVVSRGPYPPPVGSTVDMYEIGDLSAKFSSLVDSTLYQNNVVDQNAPMHGINSIIGRSIVIHNNDATGSRWVCSTIESDEPMVAAIAVFKHPVIGRVVFTQLRDDSLAETSIFVQLDYNDRVGSTTGHKLVVNTFEGKNRYDANGVASVQCQTTKPLYDPFVLSTTSGSCSKSAPFNCEVGSISDRTGHTLAIRNPTPSLNRNGQPKKDFLTDPMLPLSGPVSVVGKTLAILSTDGRDILACSTIQKLNPTSLEATFSGTSIQGFVLFDQSAGTEARKTKITLRLVGLQDEDSFAIRSLPPEAGTCNNLGENLRTLTRPANADTWYDLHLPLTGRLSVLGRSLVIMRQNTIVACTQIQDAEGSNFAYRQEAIVKFTDPVEGEIHLAQNLYKDGTSSDTTILFVDVKNVNGPQTNNHNWHVHMDPVYGDSNAETGRCSSTLGHFDPYKAMQFKQTYDECSPYNPLRCEVGDQAKKLGTHNMGEGRSFYTDVDLPLSGVYSVLGRSIVIHVAEKGAPRYACADIIPKTDDYAELKIRTPKPGSRYKTRLVSDIASVLRLEQTDIVAEVVSEENGEMKINLHFVGLNRECARKRLFEYAAEGHLKNFASYDLALLNSAGVVRGQELFAVSMFLLTQLFLHGKGW